MDTIKQISIAADSNNTYNTRDIGADAINVDVNYDADGNIITDAETTVSTKKNAAEAIKAIDESLNDKAPSSHTSVAASSSTLGHVKVGTGLSASNGTISVKYGTAAATACAGNDSRLSNSRTPKAHASTSTTYGSATSTEYGHVKLIDDYANYDIDTDSNRADMGVGASGYALQKAYSELAPKTSVSDLSQWQSSSNNGDTYRTPEITVRPLGGSADSSGLFTFHFISPLGVKDFPDCTKLILLFTGTDSIDGKSARVKIFTESMDVCSYSRELTADELAMGCKYLESEKITYLDDGTETRSDETYIWRVDALLHTFTDLSVRKMSLEVIPTEKYLDNKCEEIEAALDVANIPSDLGSTAGSAINALNTHLTDEISNRKTADTLYNVIYKSDTNLIKALNTRQTNVFCCTCLDSTKTMAIMRTLSITWCYCIFFSHPSIWQDHFIGFAFADSMLYIINISIEDTSLVVNKILKIS